VIAIWNRVSALPAITAIGLVRMYQIGISPWLGPVCRFQPTCSEYMIRAVRKHGAISGVARGLWRICRCHPLGGKGVDLP
jgi:hypothetical protein